VPDTKPKPPRPAIEDAAPLLLDAAELANLTDLISFLAEHNLRFRWHYVNTWTVNYKRQTLFTVKIFGSEKSWIFYPHCFNEPGQITPNEWFTVYDRITDEPLKSSSGITYRRRRARINARAYKTLK